MAHNNNNNVILLPPLKPAHSSSFPATPSAAGPRPQSTSNHQQPQLLRNPAMATPFKRPDIANLMSPPDVPLDSFEHDQPREQQRHRHMQQQQYPYTYPYQYAAQRGLGLAPVAPMHPPSGTRLPSPPNSPSGPNDSSASRRASSPLADPILYPAAADHPAEHHAELFPSYTAVTPRTSPHEELIDRHIASRSTAATTDDDASSRASRQLPSRVDYLVALEFTALLNPQAMREHVGAERALIREMKPIPWAATLGPKMKVAVAALAPPVKIKTRPPPSRPRPRPRPRSISRPDRVIKPSHAALQGGQGTGPRLVRAEPSGLAVSPSLARKLASILPAEPTGAPATTTRRIVAPSREDRDFNAITDYCPPLDSLPDRPGCLKIDWKGHPIGHATDPHRHLLHKEELQLAATLRLDCATYLTSKRRIFERRLACARSGKEFRKTDAQQACKIDVNKASKLWTAYDKVGWLDKKWMAQWI